MRRAKPDEALTARLEAVSAPIAEELGIAAPPCLVWPSRRVVASVRLGRHTRLRVSSAAMERLDPMALRWVLAHELGHLADRTGRRRVRVARRAYPVLLAGVLAAIALLPYWYGFAAVVAHLVIVMAAGAALRRPLERVADQTAHRLCRDDPDAARRALTTARACSGMRSERAFRVVNALAGYPPLPERMAPATR